MGDGAWSTSSYREYACSTGRGFNDNTCTMATDYSGTAQAFTSERLDKTLDPKNVVRECCDTTEHPESLPIILALDVTGSMGNTAIKIQKLLNPIMNSIYEEVKDAEIAIMAIGDCIYDNCPIQMSQFESDIRIADNLDKIYFENGGGGNQWESYTAAWYMGLRHTRLDCWKRGRKGIIITIGDEKLNPYLPREGIRHGRGLCGATGDKLQDDIETIDLYREAKEKFDMFHICVESESYPNQENNLKTFQKVMGKCHATISSVENIADVIVNAIKYYANRNTTIIVEDTIVPTTSRNSEISW